MSINTGLDARRIRAAKNQSLLREVNERIEEIVGGHVPTYDELQNARTIDLACECAEQTCTARVTMTIAEYEAIRADSNLFFVLPGHELDNIDEIVRTTPAYVVVKKLGAGATVAQRLDPRKRSRR